MNSSPVTPAHHVIARSPACPVRRVKRSRGFDLEEDADLARRIHRACSAARVGVKMKRIEERIELARQQIEAYQSEIIMLETELDDLRSQ